jgi:hypothetical protein
MKKFAGFTPEQQYTLLAKQGYDGPADQASMDKFLASTPAAVSKMGEYAQMAQQRLMGQVPTQEDPEMFLGGIVRALTGRKKKTAAQAERAADPAPKPVPLPILRGVTPEQAAAQREAERQPAPNPIQDLMKSSISDPQSVATTPDVSTLQAEQGTEIAAGTGQMGEAATASPTSAVQATTAGMPTQQAAATYDATSTAKAIEEAIRKSQAATGTVGSDSLVEAQTLAAKELAQLGVIPPQITDPTQVVPPPPRQIQPGELISGSSVDMSKVAEATDIQAAQADPSKAATVAGQLEGLMSQFEGGQTPPWAAGAMRQAMGQLQARGLGASSMAGQAVIQAAMESALPIAMADAQTVAAFESQNLSNRQQTALFAAEQRAKFLGMEFDQNFQTKVANAARISDIANLNFTSDVQIALENSRLTQTAQLANLDVSKAKMLSDMAAMTQADMANLNNRQQAAVQNAQAFLQTDLTNLNNEQQTALFNSQSRINGLFSDQAAQNAAKQFNASSENQTNQFFAGLQSTVSQFNAAQTNAIKQFNAGEANAIEQFNTQQQNLRSQFNAQNSLVIAQANAQWRQNIATINTGAQNEANMVAAKAANGFTQTTIDSVWQRERDIMAAALTTSEGDANRNLSLLLADKEAAALRQAQKAKDNAAKWQLAANLLFG